jgi:beta-mannanase
VAQLIKAARPGAVVRLGWEANGGSGHPWRIGTAANVGPYKECFRRLARIHRAAGLRVEWTNSKSQMLPYMDTYPGDDVVDLWGLHQYDNGAKGIVFADYVAQAARRGKKVGVGEWGLWRNGDNPDYVHRMFAQFRANASKLAYENYYNAKTDHMLHPRTRYPRAARAYRELWGG